MSSTLKCILVFLTVVILGIICMIVGGASFGVASTGAMLFSLFLFAGWVAIYPS
jgi:hypothetical protein